MFHLVFFYYFSVWKHTFKQINCVFNVFQSPQNFCCLRIWFLKRIIIVVFMLSGMANWGNQFYITRKCFWGIWTCWIFISSVLNLGIKTFLTWSISLYFCLCFLIPACLCSAVSPTLDNLITHLRNFHVSSSLELPCEIQSW